MKEYLHRKGSCVHLNKKTFSSDVTPAVRSYPVLRYQMNGEKLQESQEERDIGVRVSSNLKPSAQCIEAAQTATIGWSAEQVIPL